MASYFSSIASSSAISNLGTRLNSLRRAITLGDEADDPDEENCSHISNVLRAYYTEKGRPFPTWLPPDPKNPTPVPSTRVVATSQIQPGPPGMQAPAASGYGRGGGLSDLWGDTGSATPPAPQTASLRRGRSTPGGASGTTLAPAASAPSGSMGAPSPSLSPGVQTPGAIPGARPLPSQRMGSHQMLPTHPPPPERMTSAQDRLRARLQGGRSPSPGQIEPPVRKPVGGMAAGSRWGSR